jgi:hypothetical protein
MSPKSHLKKGSQMKRILVSFILLASVFFASAQSIFIQDVFKGHFSLEQSKYCRYTKMIILNKSLLELVNEQTSKKAVYPYKIYDEYIEIDSVEYSYLIKMDGNNNITLTLTPMANDVIGNHSIVCKRISY